MKEIVIVGAGASGLAAAVTAAQNGAKVKVIEKNNKPGKKLLATGNGRCNITNLDMCAFVCDYDHNAYDFNLLKSTHLPMYQAIRSRHPDIPYVIITRPNYFADPANNDKRNTIFMATYNYAIKNGDKNVWYIDGKTLFDGEYYHNCTKDGCHPNDIGFYRMSKVIGNILAKALHIESDKHDLRKEGNVFVGDGRVAELVDCL